MFKIIRPEVITPGWVIMPSSNIMHNYEGIFKIPSYNICPVQTLSESFHSQTTDTNLFVSFVDQIAYKNQRLV